MRRIRTIPQAAAEIKAKDPETIVTVTTLRKWIKRGLIPVIESGGRYQYINMEALEKFLDGEIISN